MYETKTQLRIIAALLVAVIALATGLLFYEPGDTTANTVLPQQPPPTTATHEKIRDGEISLDPSLVYTQTFGGSKDESIVDVFYESGKLYIFGNTASNDYDFDSNGAFVAIITENGKTVGFSTYEGTLKAVTLYDVGFVMALDRNGSPVAYAIDKSGNEIKSLSLLRIRNEVALDIKYVDGGYLFVSAIIQDVTEFTRLKLTVLTPTLEFSSSVVTDEVYSLSYIDTLDIMGEYRLVANALSDLRNMLCSGAWSSLAYYPKEFSYTVVDFWITGEIFYLAYTQDKTVLISESGSITELCAYSTNCSIAGDKQYMYISCGDNFFCVNGNEIVFSALYGQTSVSVYNDYVYSVSVIDNRMSVRSFLSGNKTYESSFVYNMTDARIFICQSGMFVIGNTQGKFGENDITVIKVNY